MVPPVAGFAAKSSASDSNLRRDKEEWFRLQRAQRQQGPHPILISSRQRRMVPPATRYYARAGVILDLTGSI